MPSIAEIKIKVLAHVPASLHVTTADFNGDGLIDFAVSAVAPLAGEPSGAKGEYAVYLFFQTVQGFAETPNQTIPIGTALPTGLVAGDFNGDGQADLGVGLRRDRRFLIVSALDGFQKKHISDYNNDSGGVSLAIGQMIDGATDIVSGASWRRWTDEDRYETGYVEGPTINDNWLSSLADLDHDGSDDFIFTTRSDGIRLYFGPFLDIRLIGVDAASQVVNLNTRITPGDKPRLEQIMIGDLNDDGQPDLIVGAGNQSLVYFQNSPAGFTEDSEPSLILEGVKPLLVDDLNGDDRCDVIFASVSSAQKMYFWIPDKGEALSSDWQSQAELVSGPRIGTSAALGQGIEDNDPQIFITLSRGGLAVVSLTGQ